MAYSSLGSLLSANRPVQGNLAEALAHFMPMGGGQLGGQSGGQFPAPPPPGGFAPAPSYSGSSFLDPENAMPIAAALMKGPSFGDALGNAFSAYGETSQRRKSRDYLAKNFPELATFAEAGAPIDTLWKAALDKKGLGGTDVRYSTPTLMVRPDGTQTYVMFGSDGSMKEASSGGGLTPGKVTYRNHGTYTAVLDSAGNEIGQIPIDVAGAASQKELGKGVGQNQANSIVALPAARATAKIVSDQVASLKAEPDLDAMLGPLDSRLPNLTERSARMQAKIDQIQGGAFLQARQLLKGGGAITDYEGQKAEQAFIRMNTAQSAEDFKQALDDFQAAVEQGVRNLEVAAGNAQNPMTQPGATPDYKSKYGLE